MSPLVIQPRQSHVSEAQYSRCFCLGRRQARRQNIEVPKNASLQGAVHRFPRRRHQFGRPVPGGPGTLHGARKSDSRTGLLEIKLRTVRRVIGAPGTSKQRFAYLNGLLTCVMCVAGWSRTLNPAFVTCALQTLFCPSGRIRPGKTQAPHAGSRSSFAAPPDLWTITSRESSPEHRYGLPRP
jgi:hypothetical protein